MNKSIYFGIIFLTLLSCKTNSISNNSSTAYTEENITLPSYNSEIKPYFKATGTEPFWSINIYDDKIVYKTPEDSIILPHSDPILTMDSHVKLYKTKAKSTEFNIQILEQECTNQMSGKILPYKVSVEFKKNSSSNFEKINGCGQYITDNRLNNIWVLEELNGTKVSKEEFTNMLPLLEILANYNQFFGILGCNRVNGTIFFEKGKLKFNTAASTKTICGNSNREAEFITALESISTYSFEENRLILSNSSENKIILKKINF